MFLTQHRNLVWALLSTSIIAKPVQEVSPPGSTTNDTLIYGLTGNKNDYKIVNNRIAASSIFSTQKPSTNATLPLTATNDGTIHCSPHIYGSPSPSACNSAFNQLPRGQALDRFGDRRNPDWESYAATLPFPVLSEDAKCSIELTYTDAGGSGEMTAMEIQAAAFHLVTFCVNSQHAGGIVTGLGNNGKLQMTVRQYTPQVECDTTTENAPDEIACQAVLQGFPAGSESLKFGRRAPGIDTALPVSFGDQDMKCVFKVGIAGAATYATWYDIFSAAVAVYTKCGVNDKAGKGYVLENGQRKFLVRLVNEETQLSLPPAATS